MEQDDDVAPPDAVVPGTTRPSRSAKRIVAAVTVAVIVLAALAWWVLAVPYRVDLSTGDRTERIECGRETEDDFIAILESGRNTNLIDQRCHQVKDDRRNLALMAGAGVAIAACAVSTVPSRRLTGDKLGPRR